MWYVLNKQNCHSVTFTTYDEDSSTREQLCQIIYVSFHSISNSHSIIVKNKIIFSVKLVIYKELPTPWLVEAMLPTPLWLVEAPCAVAHPDYA
jgi:hypothetical protein